MKRFFLHTVVLLLCSTLMAKYQISGVPQHISDNIQNRLTFKISEHSTEHYQILEQIRYEAIEAIKPYGYFNPSALVTLQSDTYKIEIQVGKLSYINQIIFNIEPKDYDNTVLEPVKEVINQYQDQPFTTENLALLQEDLEAALQILGYAESKTQRTHSIVDLRNLNNNQLHLNIDLGLQYRFGEITTALPEQKKCIQKYLTFAPGDLYNYQQLQATHGHFVEYSPFRDYQITSNPRKDNPSYIDIHIDYKTPEPIEYSFGFGLISSSSDQDHSFEPNLIANLTINNILDCGGRIINSINYADQDSKISSDVIIPSQSILTDFYILSASVRHFLQQSEDAAKYYMVSLQTFKNIYHLTIIPSIHYLIETSSLENPNIDENPNRYLTQLLYPKVKFRYRYNHQLGTLKAKAKFMGSEQSFQSDISFLKVSAHASSTLNTPKLLITNEVAGGYISTEQFDQLPLSMQFTLGGPESLRGIAHQQYNQGSEFYLTRNTAMVRLDQFLVGVFTDVGYCLTPTQDEVIHTAGLAVAYETPYSRFHISFGRPVSSSDDLIFLFSIDPEV
ncbi:BamA/TamA family outer membrane protein [Gammaproteobacteria bacterium]|nr:BamA/TamA family outer membrane protein [Gammaproteobacteria bacterium]